MKLLSVAKQTIPSNLLTRSTSSVIASRTGCFHIIKQVLNCVQTYKVVRDSSHSLVRQHYPYHHEVANCCDHHHASEQNAPQHLTPQWQDEDVVLYFPVGARRDQNHQLFKLKRLHYCCGEKHHRRRKNFDHQSSIISQTFKASFIF